SPRGLGAGEPRAAVDEPVGWRSPRALLVGRALVHGERPRVEHDAIVLMRSARGDEAARDVVANAHGIARSRIAPAAATTRLEPEEVAADQDDAVALAGQLALARRARIEDRAAGAARAAARDAVRRDQRVLHPRGQLGALAQHAHVADHAGAPAVEAGAARVRPHRVALDAQRELPLDVLDRVVLLADVVDDVDAVGERARPEAHAQALDAQDRALPQGVPGAEVVEDVDGRGRRHLAPVALRERAEHAGEHPEHRVRAHADRGGEA